MAPRKIAPLPSPRLPRAPAAPQHLPGGRPGAHLRALPRRTPPSSRCPATRSVPRRWRRQTQPLRSLRNAERTVPAPAAGGPLANPQSGGSPRRAPAALRWGPSGGPARGAAIARPVPRTLSRTSGRSQRGDEREGVRRGGGAGARPGAGPRAEGGRVTLASTNQEPALREAAGGGGWKRREDSMTQSGELGPRVPDRWEGRSAGRAAAGPGWAPRAPFACRGRSANVCRVAFPAREGGRREGGARGRRFLGTCDQIGEEDSTSWGNDRGEEIENGENAW